ncbi:MAG: hypothetical protein K2W95_12970 [Candidatus Obscuribacterales bacterium]|nr:hypothetical protein [Candidatus Obscuribacterales bacterium]
MGNLVDALRRSLSVEGHPTANCDFSRATNTSGASQNSTLIGLLLASAATFANCVRLFSNDCSFALKESFDTGWIIKTGEVILQNGVPMSDIFSWTFPDRAFVAYQWLFEVAAALVFKAGGLWSVGLAACLLTGTLYFYVLPKMWLQKNIPLCIPFLFLSLVLTPHWFNARPQLVSYFLMLGFVAILEKFRLSGRPRSLWLLPLLTLFWANIHSFWCIGLLLVGVYLGVDVLCGWKTKPSTISPLLPVAMASVAATLATPYGSRLLSYIWTFFDGSQYLEMFEVYPSFTSPDAIFVLGFLGAALLTMLRKRAAIPPQGWIITIGAIVAALAVRRYQSVAVLLVWPYLGMALQCVDWSQWYSKMEASKSALLNTFASPGQMKLGTNIFLFAIALLVSAGCWCAKHPTERDARNVYLEESADLLQLAGHYLKKGDRLFNDATTGDWLVLLNQGPVYLDTRYDMYPKQFCHNSFACAYGAPGALEHIQKSGITHIVIRDDFTPIGKLLQSSKEWTLIADNGHLSMWGRANQNDQRMKEMQLTDNTIRSSKLSENLMHFTIQRRCGKYVAMACELMAQQRNEEAVALLEKAVDLLPSSRILQSELAKARMSTVVGPQTNCES